MPSRAPATSSRRPRTPQLSTEIATLFPMRGEWTEDDYFDLPESNHIVELSDGRLVIPEMPSFAHQNAAGRLYRALCEHVDATRLGYVCMAPLPVRLWPGKIREPDVMFLSRDHADRFGDDVWGVPDLVVEVLSPRTKRSSGTERTDRKIKFDEYARAGVAEYWLVEVNARTVEVYVLGERQKYRLQERHEVGATARSIIVEGFGIAVEALFR